MKELETP